MSLGYVVNPNYRNTIKKLLVIGLQGTQWTRSISGTQINKDFLLQIFNIQQ